MIACPQIDNFDISIAGSMISQSTGSGGKPGQEQPGRQHRLRSNFEHHDMDAPNLDIAREPRGLHRPKLERLDRLFPEDAASTSIEDDASMNEDDASMNVEEEASTSLQPSITRRIFRTSAVFSFVVLTGVGGALAWRSYGDYPTEMIRAWALPAPPSKPAAPPAGTAEFQQQLKSIAIDLAAVKHTLEQLAANQDQLTRKQQEMAGKQEQMTQAIAALQAVKQDISQKISAPPPANKPVHVPLPKPVQHPAPLSTQASSNPTHVSPPPSLLPPKQ
jgi:hypothetical protein